MEAICKFGNGSVSDYGVANLLNRFFCQFGIRAINALRWIASVASLICHVGVVLSYRSKPKVVWIYARSIITIRAVVKYAQSGRNRTSVKYPRRDMRTNQSIGCSTLCNDPVSKVLVCGSPKPTRFSLSDLLPEAFRKGFGKTLRSQVCGSNLDYFHWCSARYGLQALPRLFIVDDEPRKSILKWLVW